MRNSFTGLLRLYLKKNWSFRDLDNKETELPKTSWVCLGIIDFILTSEGVPQDEMYLR